MIIPICRCLGRRPSTLLSENLGLRSAHYIVNQKGEKVVVSERTAVRTKREKWQKVKPMGQEEEQIKIDQIMRDQRLHCDPDQARDMALGKWQQLGDRLQRSGRCRESKPYHPPADLSVKINQICAQIFGTAHQNFDSLQFDHLSQKFKFLVKCQEQFQHQVPNSELHRMKTVADVRQFYETSVRGISPYESLAVNVDLPKNLHIIPEPLRFNPETDTFFNGINAFPGSTPEVVGLRAQKKYPTVRDNFVWPDV